jgi:hypothetical protein
MAKDINQLAGVEEGISLFTEQKKYFLKTPKPAAPAVEDTPPPPPPPVETEIPAEPTDDMGMEDMPSEPTDDMGMEDMSSEPSDDFESEGNDETVTFKVIQKLTGKLGQKIRAMEDAGEEISSKDAKYVINSILSALEDNLEEDDKMDIIGKLEGEEENFDDVEEPQYDEEPIASDEELGIGSDEENTEPASDGEMTEKFMKKVMEKVFSESKVDKVLSKYFTITEGEKKFIQNKKQVRKNINEGKKKNDLKEIIRLSESLKQKKIAEKVINSFPEVTFVGKTNKGNLVFESKDKQLKVSPNGQIL